ncbi:DNA helicase II domain protein [Candidatus Bealeia paramacronuclearis]|nr:DNA helicase II domain protein [Candidatus Bealeia paramacronuclearis]
MQAMSLDSNSYGRTPVSHAQLPEVFRNSYASLNEPQKQAVEAIDGAVLVLAGAGTGKTRVLITRLANILLSQKARPHQVLAVTFTNKASLEMRERISHLLGLPTEGLWLGTFHSIAVRILRYHAELAGLQSSFTILDADDQLRLLKQLMKAEDIDDKKYPPRIIGGIISRWKDRALLPDQINSHEFRSDSYEVIALKIYREYQARLKILNAVDFGDLLLLNLKLFNEHPDILNRYRNQFQYIMVDEYQDTNVAQYLWLRLLAQGHGNICCVGDDDQSIYGWRGAEVGNILKFEKDFPGAVVIRLEQNYRSSAHILAAASTLISQNTDRLGKTLWTSEAKGEPVIVRGVWDGEEEARVIGEEIESFHRKGYKLSDIAILVRAGFQTREFEDRFIKTGIPYKVIGGPRFYERQEIRDALAYLRILVQPQDSLAFERIINTPRRGIGNTTLQTLHQYARIEQISMTEAAHRLMDTDEVKGKAKLSLQTFFRDLTRWRSLLSTTPHGEVARIVLDESGYTAMWQQEKTPDSAGRLENLKELVGAIDEFETLPGFLEHVSLVMENANQSGGEMVSIMTLHSAKGLEFKAVFLAGWEEALFPHPRSLDENGATGLQEERRLAYVGLTRAREIAIVTYAANRRIHNQWQTSLPSRFIQELPNEHITIIGQPGLYRGNRSHQVSNPRYESSPVIPFTKTKEKTFEIGKRVFHMKFGYGYVQGIDGDKLEIAFDHSGFKKVVASFVEPA